MCSAMADRLDEIIGDPALRTRLSIAGRQTAEQVSLPRVAPLFAQALQDALERLHPDP